MKSKCPSILKSAVAIVLTVLMLLGSISSVIAATVDVATSGWNNTTWYLGNDIAKVWDNSASNCTMTKSGTVKFYYDLYLKSTDADVYYRPYEKDNYAMGPTAGNNTKVTTTGTAGSGYNDGRCWYFDTADCTESKYNKIRIWIDTSGNNGNGWSWYEKTAINNISPILTVPSTGTVGTAITLTGSSTDANKIGTLTKTYQYSTNNGSTWTNLASGSYTATSAGTVKFRYKVSDAGVKTSGSGTNGRTARVEYSSEQSCTFSAAATTYTSIAADAKGSNDGSTYNTTLSGATISANSYTTGSSALTITAGTVSGYTFAQWKVTAGSGTIGSSTSANTTFTPTASNTTVTAQYKKNYTISDGTSDTNGTVAISNTSRVAGQTYTATVTPKDGYKIKSLTVGGSAVSAAAGKTSAYTYNGTASGSSDTISVVATFEANTAMQLYIAGRFHVKDSSGNWVNTFDSGDWNAISTKIPFTYLSGTTYKVDTNATLAELSGKISNYDPVFFIYDTTNNKNWYASSATTMNTSGTTLVSSGGANSNLKFSSTSTDGPVTIYYDSNTHKIWYTIPDLYNVTVAEVTGGSVTASPARAEADTEITLTIAPTTGYQLKSITAKDSSDATVALSGTGNTRTFTMPAKDVTVTPVFEKITWSGLTAVGKYSTTAANDASYSIDFPAGDAPNITIAATSATQLDGVAVSAPANDPEGYVFAGWYTAKGSFANAANKDTTFKPNAANAVAIAKYKKIFKITSSVDNTGTGAGTVTTSKTSVEAGGSYTITATAKSGSAIESVKVNDTAKTATASQTISSVSADQTVVVKFKSNVYLKGTMNSTAWAGDVMSANSAGTSYTIANVVLNAGTTYEFKHWVDSGGDGTYSTTVSNWTLNNIATHSTKSDGYGGTNLTITPSVKAKVTFVSDGTKFTSITAIPYDSTTYNVTLTQSADYTITSTYMGVEYTTSGKSANVTVPVYSGTEFSYTITPASGKYLSGVAQSNSIALSPAFVATTHASSYTGTVSSVSKEFAVSATAANKLSVTAKTNKSTRGTVSVNNSTAAPGESITITVSPKNGVLKTLTATYANGAVYTCNLSTKAWTKTTNATTSGSNAAPASTSAKPDIAAIGANIALVASGADTTYPMTLAESSAVTINATFDTYSADSSYYYYGYDASGNAISAYNGKQMTESLISGEKFSYYEVNGRTEDDQRFKVATKATGSRRFYVETPNTTDWNGNDNMRNPYIYWFDNEWGTFEKLTYDDVHGVVDGKKWWYTTNIHEGVGCLIVNMNNTSDGGFKQTADISADDVAYGAVWISSSMSNNKYSIGGRFAENDRPSDAGTGVTYYSWGDGVYATGTDSTAPYSFGTSGFNDHDQNYAKPKGDGYKDGKYYVVVLYPNTTYTINNVTKTTGNKIDVIWMSDLPSDDETVTVYAKDGSIRSESYGSTYANIADTKIYLNNATVGTKHSGNITNQTWETYKAAKGDTLVIKTQIGATDSSTLSNAADLKAKYYVRGFCVNGEVTELLSWNADGLYTLTYKIPEDTELTKIEITPIYYLKDTTANPIVTYRVTGFTDELKAVGAGKPNWGDTLYTYPFYGKLGGQNNAFGAYPGQPMVYYKGQYQMQIPQKSTAWDPYEATAATVNNTNVSGVTMSNGYYDIVHRQIMGYGSNGASSDHVQTYDYGDFYKIFNEKKPVDNIVFDFKYETTTHNFETNAPASPTPANLTSTYKNGFELLTNFHGRTVDLFGTPLSGAAADPEQTTPVYVVSIGGVNGSGGVENIAGYYATEWKVFTSSASSPSSSNSYSLMSAGGKNSIPPEVLVLNDDDTTSFNTTTYPSADASHNITDWKALYTALEAYRGKPVMISYEAADAQIGAGNYATSGGGGATRNDGRWLYSKNGENITSTIKIQYSDNNGVSYTDLNTTNPQVTGLSAYFTNDGVEGQMTYSTTIDPDKTFDFEAKTTNGNYKFVGWYMEDGTKITSDNASHTERSGSYTFVAKFMQVTTGQLILSHSADKGTISGTNYQGEGTAKIGVVVKNGDGETVRTYDLSTSDITLDDKIIKSDNSNYTIEVTLEATATGNDSLGTTVLANPSGQDSTYFSSASTTTEGKTKTIVLNSFTVGNLFTNGTTQSVKNIIYHSYFTQAVFHYKLKFEYKDRFGNDKVFYRDGNLTSAQAANTNYVERVENGAYSTRYLRPAFIETIAPHISNFGEDITWNLQERTFSFTVNDYYYNCDHYITATTTGNNKRDVTFVLPYDHTNGIATGGNAGTAATVENFELTGDNAVDFKTIPTLLNNDVNGIYTEEGKKNWIAAPATINDDGTTKYFQYWSVKSTAAVGESDPEVARCYFQGFNFIALDNYIVTPIYGSESTDISSSGIYTGATYLDTTRNQWNTNADSEKNAKDTSGNRIAADLLFNDFILNYNYKGVELYKNGADSEDVEVGVVVERVKELDINQDGSKNTNISNYTSVAENLDTVENIINGSTTDSKFTKSEIAKTELDNKNRIHFYNAFYNGAGWNFEKQSSVAKYAYKNYVFRAYTYIKYKDEQNTDQIELSVPTYFTMYNEATANYVAPTTASTNN